MKIVYYAPNSALPAAFTHVQAAWFRVWAQGQIADVFPGCDVLVSPAGMVDETCQLTAIEGGSIAKAAEAYNFCQKLLGRFCKQENISRHAAPVRQVWIGGFCKWEDN